MFSNLKLTTLHEKMDFRLLSFFSDDLKICTHCWLAKLSCIVAKSTHGDAVSGPSKGDLFSIVQPYDVKWRLLCVGDDTAQVDHGTDVHKHVRATDDERRRLYVIKA